jgi:hypothetical protein
MLFGFSTFSLWTYNLSANEVKYKGPVIIGTDTHFLSQLQNIGS